MDTSTFNRSDYTLDLIAASIGATPASVADKLLADASVRRYVVIDTIAETRLSTVFAAVDRLLSRAVALKVHHAQEPFPRRQVMFGSRAMARLEHPNVVRVYDLGEQDGWLYSTMELCDGDLRAWSPSKSWADIVERLIEAGLGLEAIHVEGLVHGDVKPDNILIHDGRAKLGDLGLATTGGWGQWIRGSAGYIAPEIGDGQTQRASDVFAFACAIWASIYGRPPFGASNGGDGETQRLIDRARARAVLPLEVDPGVPDLSESLLPALEPRPEDRIGLGELLDLLVGLRGRGMRMRRFDFDLAADGLWARGVIMPWPTEIEHEGQLILEQLIRVVSAVLCIADCERVSIPPIEVNNSWTRPALSLRGDALEFFREGGSWHGRIVGDQDRSIRPQPGAAVARPEDAQLHLWVGELARDFIGTRIGSQS